MLSFTLEGIPAGDYEARLFFRNSFDLEAKVGFSVENRYPPETEFSAISTDWLVNSPRYLGSVFDTVLDRNVTRITNRRVGDANAQPYPKVQAWNSDMGIIRLGYRLYDAHSYPELAVTQGKKINGGVNHMRWSTREPAVFYGIDSDGVNEAGHASFNVGKATISEDRIDYTPLHSFSKASYELFTLGKYEGSIDFKDRYVVFAARKRVGPKVLTAIVYDMERGEVIANRDLNNIGWLVDTSEAA